MTSGDRLDLRRKTSVPAVVASRVGALAFAAGLGVAVTTGAGIAAADTSDSDGGAASANSSDTAAPSDPSLADPVDPETPTDQHPSANPGTPTKPSTRKHGSDGDGPTRTSARSRAKSAGKDSLSSASLGQGVLEVGNAPG